ncbi:hypothetical protein DdX_17282 [Ditylenchus destructor]|uniref:Uncharacterized protein n=1 Tax=Ditylenchus destructor TaxID=166010 RepID=A0AAD4QVX8_9BILA|nr:hypothetical protein DdX_17282 [Ditylenchus destructor]
MFLVHNLILIAIILECLEVIGVHAIDTCDAEIRDMSILDPDKQASAVAPACHLSSGPLAALSVLNFNSEGNIVILCFKKSVHLTSLKDKTEYQPAWAELQWMNLARAECDFEDGYKKTIAVTMKNEKLFGITQDGEAYEWHRDDPLTLNVVESEVKTSTSTYKFINKKGGVLEFPIKMISFGGVSNCPLKATLTPPVKCYFAWKVVTECPKGSDRTVECKFPYYIGLGDRLPFGNRDAMDFKDNDNAKTLEKTLGDKFGKHFMSTYSSMWASEAWAYAKNITAGSSLGLQDKGKKLGKELGKKLGEELASEYGNKVAGPMGRQIAETLDKKFGCQTLMYCNSTINPRIPNLKEKLKKEFQNRIGKLVEELLSSEIGPQIGEIIGEAVGKNFPDKKMDNQNDMALKIGRVISELFEWERGQQVGLFMGEKEAISYFKSLSNDELGGKTDAVSLGNDFGSKLAEQTRLALIDDEDIKSLVANAQFVVSNMTLELGVQLGGKLAQQFSEAFYAELRKDDFVKDAGGIIGGTIGNFTGAKGKAHVPALHKVKAEILTYITDHIQGDFESLFNDPKYQSIERTMKHLKEYNDTMLEKHLGKMHIPAFYPYSVEIKQLVYRCLGFEVGTELVDIFSTDEFVADEVRLETDTIQPTSPPKEI